MNESVVEAEMCTMSSQKPNDNCEKLSTMAIINDLQFSKIKKYEKS